MGKVLEEEGDESKATEPEGRGTFMGVSEFFSQGASHLWTSFACVLSCFSCVLLCDTMDCSPPGSSVHRIFQARILEWAAIPPSGDLPDPGIEPRSPAWQVDSLLSENSHTCTFLTTISCNGCWLRRSLHNRYSWSTKRLKNFELNKWSHLFKIALCRRKSCLIKLSKHYFSGEV